jgi:hypothetical protein
VLSKAAAACNWPQAPASSSSDARARHFADADCATLVPRNWLRDGADRARVARLDHTAQIDSAWRELTANEEPTRPATNSRSNSNFDEVAQMLVVEHAADRRPGGTPAVASAPGCESRSAIRSPAFSSATLGIGTGRRSDHVIVDAGTRIAASGDPRAHNALALIATMRGRRAPVNCSGSCAWPRGHFWHLDIHQDQIVALPRMARSSRPLPATSAT